MNKEQFLKELERHLSRLSKAERDDILGDFVEYFECAAAGGEDEAVLCARLGDPRKLAKEYHAQSIIESANATGKLGGMMRAFFYSAGLGSVNLLYAVFVVSVGYIAISVFFITAAALAAAGAAALVSAVVNWSAQSTVMWLTVFGTGALAAFGVLMFIGNMELTKRFNHANMAFLNKISGKIKKAGENK